MLSRHVELHAHASTCTTCLAADRERMSLFQFGFTSRKSKDCRSETRREPENELLPSTLPTLRESGLGRVEYDAVTTAVHDDSLLPTKKRRRGMSGTYTTYKPTDRAKIGKYALENGRARRHFMSDFPNLGESTVRYFKKA